MKDESDNSTDSDVAEDRWTSAAGYLVFNGETEPLARLLETAESPVPGIARLALSEYLRGKIKKPDMRGRHNSSLTFDQREEIRSAMNQLYSNTEVVLIHLHDVADQLRKEPYEVKEFINFTRRRIIKSIADKYGISANTVRQMYSLDDIAGWSQFFAGEIELEIAGTGQKFSFPEGLGGTPSRSVMKARALAQALEYMEHPEVFFDPLRPREEPT